jgi:cob(I)alamin adenosyltransferase
VDKDSPLLEAIGTIDELQALVEIIGDEEKIADDLMEIMGFLVCESKIDLNEKIEFLERETGGDLNGFVKFKNKKALELNLARTVARRAERRLVTLNKEQKIDENILKYFNRLSDYFFKKAIKN